MISITPEKILLLFNVSSDMNSYQSRIFGYLQHFIGHMKIEEACRFLRFTTGSSVVIGKPLRVTFKNLSGLARRPIAHTCDAVLELPSSYMSCIDFEEEFSAILSDSEFSWQMDAI